MDDLTAALARDLDGAFPTLVESAGPKLYWGLRRLCDDHQEAEDLTQETFIRAYRSLGGFDPGRFEELRLSPWLWTIALNLGRNHLRSRSRRPRFVEMHEDAASEDSEPPDTAAWDHRLSALPINQRRAVVLRHVVGLGIGEISEATGRPEGTVKADIHRGLDRLSYGARTMSIEDQLSGLAGGLPDGISEGVALGTGLADGYDLYPSPLGEVVVTFNIEGVSSLDLATKGYETRFADRHGRRLFRAEPPADWGRHIPKAMEAGTPGRLPVDLRSRTPFENRVLHIAATIPRGEVRPYGWLAREAEKPGASRAVGSTMARNPIPLIIPCHRVVRSDGHLGEYSLGGPHNKWELLTHEGVEPARLVELAEHHVRVQGDPATGVYCHPTCHVIRASGEWNVADFNSTAAARSAGFRPCEVCRPG